MIPLILPSLDIYHVGEDFIPTRDKFIQKLFILSYESNARDLGYCEELQVLQRYSTIHEKLIYLTTHCLILGMSDLSCSYLKVNQEIEKIFEQEKLEEDIIYIPDFSYVIVIIFPFFF